MHILLLLLFLLHLLLLLLFCYSSICSLSVCWSTSLFVFFRFYFSLNLFAYSDLLTDLPMQFHSALSLSLSFAHSTLILSQSHSFTQLKLSRPAQHSRPAPSSVDPWQSASSAVASASDNDLLWLPRRRSSDAAATRATHVKHSLKG